MRLVTLKSQLVARDERGFPVAWASGGYPVYHVTPDANVLCPACARESERHGSDDPPEASDVNWEDPELYCDDCGERIESAYAEEDEEESERS